MLGTVADDLLAYWTKVPEEFVRLRREERGIPVFSQESRQWKAEEDEMLGKWPDEEVARALGTTRVVVQQRRQELGISDRDLFKHRTPKPFSPEEDALLGKESDVVVARELGRTPVSVRSRREILGIPGNRGRWSEKDLVMLGRLPDAEVARRTGRTARVVRQKREELGIAEEVPLEKVSGRN
jgi:hypothetical protein